MPNFTNRLVDSFITQQGVSLGLILGTPIYTDTTDENNIYLGYCDIDKNLDKDEEVLICKIVVNGGETIKYFATGSWDDRANLQYK